MNDAAFPSSYWQTQDGEKALQVSIELTSIFSFHSLNTFFFQNGLKAPERYHGDASRPNRVVSYHDDDESDDEDAEEGNTLESTDEQDTRGDDYPTMEQTARTYLMDCSSSRLLVSVRILYALFPLFSCRVRQLSILAATQRKITRSIFPVLARRNVYSHPLARVTMCDVLLVVSVFRILFSCVFTTPVQCVWATQESIACRF